MARRKRFTERQVLAVAIQQGARIPCGCAAMPPSFPRCGLLISDPATAIREHLDQLGPGGKWGADSVANCAYFRKECADIKTYGTKATSLNSDTHTRAKAKRAAAGGRKRKGRKLQSRPFPATARPFPSRPWPSRSPRRPS